jgi:hypothetical protein
MHFRNKFIGIILLFLWIVKFKFVVLKINNHMSQEELLVLIYKKDETFTHLYDINSKSLFSVIEF